MKTIAGIVLAAGRSRRMGLFKPLLPFGETTIIESCINNLRRGGVQSIVLVVGHRAAELQQHLEDADVTFALNPYPDGPMSDSIACGIRVLPPEAAAVLITPADHPAVPRHVIQNLIGAWENGASMVVPTWQGRGGHPVLIDCGFHEELLDLDRSRGLRAFFDFHKEQVTRLSVDSGFIARDMDTWDDYQALHQDVFGTPPKQAFDDSRRTGSDPE